MGLIHERDERRWNPPRRAALAAVIGAVALAVSVAACGDDDNGGDGNAAAKADGPTQVRVAHGTAVAFLPLQVAEERGIFARHGLDVTLRVTPSTDVSSFPAALGRQYDVIYGSSIDFLTAASRGIDIRAFAGLVDTTHEVSNAPLITKDPSIKSAKDLVGKRVGVPSLGSVLYKSMVYSLEKAGVDPKSVDFVAVQVPAMLDQLNAGRIDAATPAIPFYSPALAQGYRIAFDPILDAVGQDDALNLFLSTSSSFAKEHPEAIERFQESLKEADAWIAQNESETRQLSATWLKLPPQVAEDLPLPIFDAEMSVERLQPYVPIVEQAGEVEDVPDVSTLVIPTN